MEFDVFELCVEDILILFRLFFEELCIDFDDELLKMFVGVFGYLGYDIVRLIEYLFNINLDLIGIFDGLFICFMFVVVFDVVRDEIILFILVCLKVGVFVCVVYI